MHGVLRLRFLVFIVACVNALPQNEDSSNDLILNEATLETSDISNGAGPASNKGNSGSNGADSDVLSLNNPDTSNNVNTDVSDILITANPGFITSNNPNAIKNTDYFEESTSNLESIFADSDGLGDGTSAFPTTWLEAARPKGTPVPGAPAPESPIPDTPNPRSQTRPPKVPASPKSGPPLSKPPPYYCVDGKTPACCRKLDPNYLDYMECSWWSEFVELCDLKKGMWTCCLHIYYPEPNKGVQCSPGFAYPQKYKPAESKEPGKLMDGPVQKPFKVPANTRMAPPPRYRAADGQDEVPDECPAESKEMCQK